MGIFGSSKAKSKGGKKAKAEPRLFDDEEDDGFELKAPPRSKSGKGSKVAKKRAPASWKWGLTKFLFKAGFLSACAVAVAGGFIFLSLDQRGLLEIPKREPGAMILASNGNVLAEEGSFYGDAAKISNLPDYVPNAVIAIEDRRFRSHYGIDPVGLARAMGRNALSGHLVQGGSTLTQQLAKNLFLTQERTLTRKAQEAVLALWLEHKFTKDEILQLYLNRVYFGAGATGIEQAAHTYFNKSAADLSVMEAARLAACLKAPTNYAPNTHPDDNTTRAKLVVAAMKDQGFITEDDAIDAETEGPNTSKQGHQPPRQYAVDWIDAQLPELVKNYDQSIVIETTLDQSIQANAENALQKRLQESGKKLAVGQGAMVVMDNRGGVLALVGGRSYAKSQYNRALKAERQPGSAFKPFVYLTAMEHGLHPSSTEFDAPIRIGNWSPENYKHKYQGEVTLQQAFAQSLNTVAARIAVNVGPDAVVATARRMGISSPLSADASIALGTSEVTPLEMTTAFVPFANGGTAVAPWVVKRITTRDGKVLYERKGSGLGQVVADPALGEMNQMFRAVVREGTGQKAQFGSWDIGGKTGTTQDYRDAWFVGFTPYLTAAVWLGNDDNSPTNQVTGGSLPAQIWRDVMEPAHKGLKWITLPGEPENAPPPGNVVAEQMPDAAPPPEQAPVPAHYQDKPKNIFDLLFGKKAPQQQAGNGLY